MCGNGVSTAVRRDARTEHRVAQGMPRKGFPRVTPEQSRAATADALRGLRDKAVELVKAALRPGVG